MGGSFCPYFLKATGHFLNSQRPVINADMLY